MGLVKLVRKNLTPLLVILFLGLVIGTLAWNIVERIFAEAGMPFSLSTGRIGFDVDVLAVYIRVNPGSFLGAAGGVLLFRAL